MSTILNVDEFLESFNNELYFDEAFTDFELSIIKKAIIGYHQQFSLQGQKRIAELEDLLRFDSCPEILIENPTLFKSEPTEADKLWAKNKIGEYEKQFPHKIQSGLRWVKWSDEPPQSKIWRVRYSEHGTHSIDSSNAKDETKTTLIINGEGYQKTNIEWLDERSTESQQRLRWVKATSDNIPKKESKIAIQWRSDQSKGEFDCCDWRMPDEIRRMILKLKLDVQFLDEE
jgi:hypothetical protein